MLFRSDEVAIAEEIVGNINEDGYFQGSLEEIAGTFKKSVSEIEAVLAKIQNLEPAGIAARNLQETLLLQLKKKQEDAKRQSDPKEANPALVEMELARRLISEQLSLLEKRNWTALARGMTVSPEEIVPSILHSCTASDSCMRTCLTRAVP